MKRLAQNALRASVLHEGCNGCSYSPAPSNGSIAGKGKSVKSIGAVQKGGGRGRGRKQSVLRKTVRRRCSYCRRNSIPEPAPASKSGNKQLECSFAISDRTLTMAGYPPAKLNLNRETVPPRSFNLIIWRKRYLRSIGEPPQPTVLMPGVMKNRFLPKP